MRTRGVLVVGMLVMAVPAFAEDTCEVSAGPHDVVKKSGDVVIEAGQVVEDAIAFEGTVTIKKGAKVVNAIALHGGVVIEAGANVTKTALAISGTVHALPGSTVHSRVEITDKGLKVRGESGDDVDLNLVIGGKSLGQRIVDETLAKTRHCQIVK